MGYVYSIVHIETGKMYIGSTNGKNPKYITSGVAIRKAIEEEGMHAFSRTILYEGDDFRDVEYEMVAELLERGNTYNYGNVNFKTNDKSTIDRAERIRIATEKRLAGLGPKLIVDL